MFHKISCAIALAVFCLTQTLSAQWQLTPQYDEVPSNWSSWGSEISGAQQGYQIRPYAPYPGQPGFQSSGVFPQPMTQLQPLPSYLPSLPPQSSVPFADQQQSIQNGEIIVSEDPVDGEILGVVQQDGSLVPLNQLRGSAQASGETTQAPNGKILIPSNDQPSEDLSSDPEMSGVGDNFGDPIVEPGEVAPERNKIVILESVDQPPKQPETPAPGALSASDAVAPSITPQQVIDERLKRESEIENPLRDSKSRIEKMATVLKDEQTELRNKEALSKLQGEHRKLRQKAEEQLNLVKKAEAQLKDKDEAFNTLQSEHRKLQQVAKNQLTAVKNAEAKLKDKDEAFNKLQGEYRELQQVAKKQLTAVKNADEKLKLKGEALTKLHVEHRDLQQKVEKQKAVYRDASKFVQESQAKHRMAFNKQIAKLESEKETLADKFRDSMAKIESQTKTMNLQSESSSEKMADTRKKLVDANRELVKLRREVEDANSSIEKMRSQQKQLVESAAKASEDAKSKTEDAGNELARVKTELTQLTEKHRHSLAALESQTKTLGLQSGSSSRELSETKKKLVEANRKMVRLRREIDDATAAADLNSKRQKDYLEQNARVKMKFNKLVEQHREAKMQLESTQTSNRQTESTTELSDTRKKLVQKNRDMVKLRREIDEAKTSIERLEARNRARISSFVKLKQELATKEKEFETRTAEMSDEFKKRSVKMRTEFQNRSDTNSDTAKKLKIAREQLAAQKKKYAKLKTKFIEAFEAEKGDKAKNKSAKKKGKKGMSEAEVREQWQKKREMEARKSRGMKKSKDESKDKETEAKSDKDDKLTKKERKVKRQKADLIEEMKKKMSESAARIRAVGKKKVDALIEDGNKKDSDEVKEAQDLIDESVKIANRKIRARYERRLKRMK